MVNTKYNATIETYADKGTIMCTLQSFHLALVVPEGKRHGPQWKRSQSLEGFADMLLAFGMMLKAGDKAGFNILSQQLAKAEVELAAHIAKGGA